MSRSARFQIGEFDPSQDASPSHLPLAIACGCSSTAHRLKAPDCLMHGTQTIRKTPVHHQGPSAWRDVVVVILFVAIIILLGPNGWAILNRRDWSDIATAHLAARLRIANHDVYARRARRLVAFAYTTIAAKRRRAEMILFRFWTWRGQRAFLVTFHWWIPLIWRRPGLRAMKPNLPAPLP
jgi:hypothetical protein